MKRIYKSAFLVVSSSLFFGQLTGCISAYSRPDAMDRRCAKENPIIYPGIRSSASILLGGGLGTEKMSTKEKTSALDKILTLYGMQVVVITIDTPFSFVLDTVLLPYDIKALINCGTLSKNKSVVTTKKNQVENLEASLSPEQKSIMIKAKIKNDQEDRARLKKELDEIK